MGEHIEILVYGLGAIGGLFSYILSRSSHVRVSVVARSNFDVVKENGLTIESNVYGTHVLRPRAVVKSFLEALDLGSFDYIILAHKALSLSTIPEGLQSLITSQTTIVILQNGIGTEEVYSKAFPENTIITSALWVAAHQPKVGTITHGTSVRTCLGLYPSSVSSSTSQDATTSLQRFAHLLESQQLPAPTFSSQEMQVQKWEKLTMNAVFSGLTALSGLDSLSWLKSSDEAMRVTRRLMSEIINVAAADGVIIRDSYADELIEQILSLPPLTSSMQVDIQEGRKLEVDVIYGVVVNRAEKHGLSVPTLEVVCALLMGIDNRLTGGELEDGKK